MLLIQNQMHDLLKNSYIYLYFELDGLNKDLFVITHQKLQQPINHLQEKMSKLLTYELDRMKDNFLPSKFYSWRNEIMSLVISIKRTAHEFHKVHYLYSVGGLPRVTTSFKPSGVCVCVYVLYYMTCVQAVITGTLISDPQLARAHGELLVGLKRNPFCPCYLLVSGNLWCLCLVVLEIIHSTATLLYCVSSAGPRTKVPGKWGLWLDMSLLYIPQRHRS